MISEEVSHYRIIEKLAEGGMGVVYLAIDTRLNRDVALKILSEEFTKNGDMLRRFEQEARAASSLNHPNIITIYDIGQVGNIHFIATEFIKGETLRHHISAKSMTPIEVLDIVQQVCKALSAAHEAGIIHRDIKPENIMLRPDGIIKVLDFGLAKIALRHPLGDPNRPTIVNVATQPGTLLGTYKYMSPEQARGLEVDTRTDIFSLGVMLYEMIAGQYPFDGQTGTDVLLAIANQEPRPLTFYMPDAPAELQLIVNKALQKGCEARYQTVDELLTDLVGLRRGLEFEPPLNIVVSPRDEDKTKISAGENETSERLELKKEELELPSFTLHQSSIPPPPSTGFIERQDEDGRDLLNRIKEALIDQGRQLVALWGAGGVGKTTLAAKAARELMEVFAGRVIWVSADGIPNFTLSSLLDEVALKLGRSSVNKLAIEFKEEEVRKQVADTTTLIVLDNFDTLIPEEQQRCAEFLKSLNSCSALITTRERLEKGHNVCVSNMSVDEAHELINRFISEQAHDRQVFAQLDRDSIISATEANPLVLYWILAQIDLAQDPDEVLDDLARGEGEAAQRVFDRSFNLTQLGNHGRAVLLALSLFVPSASKSALAAVAGVGNNKIRLKRTIKRLSSLWLIRGLEGNKRLVVEGLTRQLAIARLSKDSRNNKSMRKRFSIHFAGYAFRHKLDFDALEAEISNIVAAIDYACEQESWMRVMNILDSVFSMLETRGYWDEAVKCCEQALEAARRVGKEGWIAHYGGHRLAPIHQMRGNLNEAMRLHKESLELSIKLRDDASIGMNLHNLGVIAYHLGDFTEAEQLYFQSLNISRKRGEETHIAATLHQQGFLAYYRGRIAEAKQLHDEGYEIEKRLNNEDGIAKSLSVLAQYAEDRGDSDEAHYILCESLEISRRLGNKADVASFLTQMGLVAKTRRDFAEARKLCQESLENREELGDQRGIAFTLSILGDICLDEMGLQQAEEYLIQSLSISRRLGQRTLLVEVLPRLGNLRVAQGKYSEACALLAESLEIAETLEYLYGIGSTKLSLGILRMKEDRREEAIEMIREALNVFDKLGHVKATEARQILERL